MIEKYHLSQKTVLKWLETPCIYQISTDELYELDMEAFHLMKSCALREGCTVGDEDLLSFCIDEGLLIREFTGPRLIPERMSTVPSLRYLELQVTSRCNLRCAHCYLGEPERIDMDSATLMTALREFQAMQGLRLLITGGEPLLYQNFDYLNDALPAFEFRKVLFTNGLLLSRDRLKGLNVDEIQVSIDGIGESHELIRGKGTYGRALNALESAKECGFDVAVSTMVHTGNLDDFEEMDKLFRLLGVKDWTVDVPCEAGLLCENRGILPPPIIAGNFLKYGFGNALHGGGEGYSCGRHLMAVTPDGRAAKCGFYADRPVGYIDEGLELCWNRIEHIPLAQLECDCSAIESCRGGCRFRAEMRNGLFGKDPYRCASLIPSIEQE